MTRSIASDFSLLLRGRLKRLGGVRRSTGRAGLIRAGLVVFGALLFTGGLYAGAYRFLYWIIARTDYVGGLLTAQPTAGLDTAQTAALPPPAAVYTAIAGCLALFLAASGAAAWTGHRWLTGRSGMATHHPRATSHA